MVQREAVWEQFLILDLENTFQVFSYKMDLAALVGQNKSSFIREISF